MSITVATAATQVGLSAITAIADRAMAFGKNAMNSGNDSLVAFTQAARVEPIVLIDTDVLFVDELTDVLQTLQSIFAGYYLQAVALNNTIGHVSVHNQLAKFNPNRQGSAGVVAGSILGGAAGHLHGLSLAAEAYRDRLPTYFVDNIAIEADGSKSEGKQLDPDEAEEQAADKAFKKSKRASDSAKLNREEAARDADDKNHNNNTFENRDRHLRSRKIDDDMQRSLREEGERQRVAVSFGKDAISDLKENANLSVGKMFEVTIKHEDKTFTVPISIRLIANTIPTSKLVHILSLGSEDTSAHERYHAWKSGRLAFFKDLLFCRDLIDAHRRNLLADGDAIYTNIIAKERRNSLAAIADGNPSVASASNLLVTSQNSISELELSLNGKFSNFNIRQKIFEKTSLMIVAVIDKEWSRVQFYHRGLHDVTDVSFRDLKSSASKSGPDVSDILKAYQVGAGPSL